MAGSQSRSHWIALPVRGLEVTRTVLMFCGLANGERESRFTRRPRRAKRRRPRSCCAAEFASWSRPLPERSSMFALRQNTPMAQNAPAGRPSLFGGWAPSAQRPDGGSRRRVLPVEPRSTHYPDEPKWASVALRKSMSASLPGTRRRVLARPRFTEPTRTPWRPGGQVAAQHGAHRDNRDTARLRRRDTDDREARGSHHASPRAPDPLRARHSAGTLSNRYPDILCSPAVSVSCSSPPGSSREISVAQTPDLRALSLADR
jgi:hypothetical protein